MHGGSFLEEIFETQAPDLPPEDDLSVGAKPDKVKHVLANIDADDRQ